MNKKLFLFMAVLLMTAILFSPVNKAYAGIGFKQKVDASGIGAYLEASQDAPLEIRKQEAFVAAFLDGIRNIAEQIAKREKPQTTEVGGKALFISLRKNIGGFEVDSRIIMNGTSGTPLK